MGERIYDWGLPQSYWFCFDGIERGSPVAVSTLGVRTEKDLFMQGYREMLRRLEPEVILCYSDPFPEMEGHVVAVDYAETNHLSRKAAEESPKPYAVHKRGYVVSAGMGQARGEKPYLLNRLPQDDSQLKHIFREKEGHLPDTKENRDYLERLANDEKCYQGTDERGNSWYAETLPDGSQGWVSVRDGIIQNGGINGPDSLYGWDDELGWISQNEKLFDFVCQKQGGYLMELQLNRKQILYAVYFILGRCDDGTLKGNFPSVLSDLCPFTFKGGRAADMATFEDLIDCVIDLYGGFETVTPDQAFEGMRRFVSDYAKIFKYDPAEVMNRIDQAEWLSICGQVVEKYPDDFPYRYRADA